MKRVLTEAQKAIQKSYMASYRLANKEKRKVYLEENKERISSVYAAYLEAHREEKKKYLSDYRSRNKEKVRDLCANWKRLNKDKVKDYNAYYKRENPDITRINDQNRRARKKNGVGKLSSGLVKLLINEQDNKCIYCCISLDDKGYHMDHIMPLSLGGLHEDSNIQLLCPTCNLSKHNIHPDEFKIISKKRTVAHSTGLFSMEK